MYRYTGAYDCTGKRKIRRYNRNAAYEQELHREANRRAVVRAKRQASSKARERLQQQQRDQSLDHDNDDTVLEEPWEMSEHNTTPTGAKKAHQGAGRTGSKGGSRNSSLATSGKGGTPGKGSSAGGSGQHKEDYESDVEDVPDDLAAEMVPEEGVTKKKKAAPSRGGKLKSKQAMDDDDADPDGGLEVEGDYEADQLDVISSIPVENVPVPADVKKLTINKNSGETLLHRAARIGHEREGDLFVCTTTQVFNPVICVNHMTLDWSVESHDVGLVSLANA
ncbi:hypothetical protein Btru_039448 [Bulinus truncatus]|nr:hypothetical protein Btru_039448 [Bulinus truncatus]